MKKLTLLLLLAFQGAFLFAQKDKEKLFIGTSKLYESDTPRTFLIFGVNHDSYQKDFLKVAGKPSSNTTGIMQWNDVAVAGLSDHTQVKLTDGIMTKDKINETACFIAFTSPRDKKKKLATLQSNQERYMEISFLNTQGDNIVHTPATEEISRDFLYKVYQRK